MKKIILFVLFLILTILFTSCSTQQKIVYRDCNCNTTTFGFGWNANPYWRWNNSVWGSWNSWNFYPYRVIPRYYIPNRVQSPQPTRYERRTRIGERPTRNGNDNTYPYRTPTIPRMEIRSSQQNRQPSRIQNNTNRYTQSQQKANQSVPNRSVNTTPSRIQQRTTSPTNNQPTRSRSNNN